MLDVDMAVHQALLQLDVIIRYFYFQQPFVDVMHDGDSKHLVKLGLVFGQVGFKEVISK
jgi:hypothetical protein